MGQCSIRGEHFFWSTVVGLGRAHGDVMAVQSKTLLKGDLTGKLVRAACKGLLRVDETKTAAGRRSGARISQCRIDRRNGFQSSPQSRPR